MDTDPNNLQPEDINRGLLKLKTAKSPDCKRLHTRVLQELRSD